MRVCVCPWLMWIPDIFHYPVRYNIATDKAVTWQTSQSERLLPSGSQDLITHRSEQGAAATYVDHVLLSRSQSWCIAETVNFKMCHLHFSGTVNCRRSRRCTPWKSSLLEADELLQECHCLGNVIIIWAVFKNLGTVYGFFCEMPLEKVSAWNKQCEVWLL